MRAQWQCFRRRAGDEESSDRQASTERFRHRDYVWRYIFPFETEHLPCPSHATLNFVEYEERVVLIAEGPQVPQEPLSGWCDSPLTLHGLHKHGTSLIGNLSCNRVRIVEYAIIEAAGAAQNLRDTSAEQ